MYNKGLILAFILLCFISYYSSAFIPFPLLPFTPFLVWQIRKSSFPVLFSWALLCGLLNDMGSLQYRLGISSVVYLLCVLAIYPLRRYLYEDKIVAFLSLSYLFSFLATLLFMGIAAYKHILEIPSFLTGLREIFVSPLIDALFGFIFLFIPIKIYAEVKLKKRKQLIESSEL